MIFKDKRPNKFTGIIFILYIVLSLLSACNNSTINNEKPLSNKEGSTEANKTKSSDSSINVIKEQDPNGIFWGLRDTLTHKLILDYRCQQIWDFHNGFAMVMINGNCGLVNRFGKIVVDPFYNRQQMEAECGVVAFEMNNGPVDIWTTNGKLIMSQVYGVSGILPCQQRISRGGDDGFGMINFKGDTILPFKFRGTLVLPEGFCIASSYDNDLCGLYDLNGKLILPQVFTRIEGFYCGRAIVEKNGRFGLIDEKGKEVDCRSYSNIKRFNNGLAVVQKNSADGSEKIGAIDKNGHEVIPVNYQSVEFSEGFQEGLIAMKLNRKVGFLDTTGKIVVQFKYSQVEPFRNGIAKVWADSEHAGYINKNGKEIIPINFDTSDQNNLRRYHDKYIIGLKDSLEYVFDYFGKKIATLHSDSYGLLNVYEFDMREKSLVVSQNGKFGTLDSNFQIQIPLKYQSLELIFPGQIAAREKGKVSFINTKGQSISKLKIDSIEMYHDNGTDSYENGLAIVTFKGKKGLINSYKKVIVPIIYDEIDEFSFGLAAVKRHGKYGFVNTRGKEVIPTIYNKIKAFEEYQAEVTLKGETFQIDRTGKKVENDEE